MTPAEKAAKIEREAAETFRREHPRLAGAFSAEDIAEWCAFYPAEHLEEMLPKHALDRLEKRRAGTPSEDDREGLAAKRKGVRP